jgi:hypothetical protein
MQQNLNVFSYYLIMPIHFLGIVVERMRQDDPILKEKLFQIKGAKGLSIFYSDFGRGTKPCYDPLLKKAHDDFLSCVFCWDVIYTPVK